MNAMAQAALFVPMKTVYARFVELYMNKVQQLQSKAHWRNIWILWDLRDYNEHNGQWSVQRRENHAEKTMRSKLQSEQ
uniref:Transposase n=1 Tax=Ascaris lumbricoides TaxID=6252 RepID=A0A0M3IVE9_ASCLU